ncbi:MAG: GAD domain-containing protein [Phycisphaerales bacterium]
MRSPRTRASSRPSAYRVVAEKFSRKVTDAFNPSPSSSAAGGVPTVKYTGGEFSTGIAKFLGEIQSELVERLGLEDGDAVVFGADTYSVVTKTLGELRLKIAREHGYIPEDQWNFLWVYDFPDVRVRRGVGRHYPAPPVHRADQGRSLAPDGGRHQVMWTPWNRLPPTVTT